MHETNRENDERAETPSAGENAQASVKRLGKKAVEQARSAAETGKAQLADGAEHVADALRHASDGLRSDEQSELADYTRRVADGIERAAEAIKSRDLASLASEATRFAQRQPALFLGGAFTAGLFAARFLKSSASRATERDSTSGQSQTAFDRARGTGAPRAGGMGEARDDGRSLDELTAPSGYGPAPGGYGPASAPAGAHGGAGTFGADGAGGGPGNAIEPDGTGRRGAAE